VTHTAQFVAELRGVSSEVLAAQTSANFLRLFNKAVL
jgi:Tat protein secretion system quality control protein TatD with DNase activity